MLSYIETLSELFRLVIFLCAALALGVKKFSFRLVIDLIKPRISLPVTWSSVTLCEDPIFYFVTFFSIVFFLGLDCFVLSGVAPIKPWRFETGVGFDAGGLFMVVSFFIIGCSSL